MSAAAKASSDALTSVPEPPSDSISSLCFGRESDFLAASSWDSRLRVYDGGAGGLLWSAQDEDPLLSCAFGGTDDAIFAAGLSGNILQYDPTSTAEATRLGSHSAPVSCLCYDAYATNTLLSGGWDGCLKQWDLRVPSYLVATTALGAGAAAQGRVSSPAALPNAAAPGATEQNAATAAAAAAAAIAPAPASARAVALDVSGHHVVVACGARAIEVFDVRRLDRFIQARESSLAAQTRALKCSPDGERFVVAGLEGRVAVEFIDPSPEAQSGKYAFKCAQQSLSSGAKLVHGIHALAFHPVTHAFAAGAQSGAVSVWDAAAKKRIAAFPALSGGVTALAFSRAGTRLAAAVSYAWEFGDPAAEGALDAAKAAGETKPAVVIRKLTDAQVRLGAK